MSFDFRGQRALVTGGTSGIGLGIAQALADAGVDMTATGVSEVSAVEAAARESHVRFQPLDVRDADAVQRWGRPEDVAGPMLFLCSPVAAFVTGVILPVDGGYSIA